MVRPEGPGAHAINELLSHIPHNAVLRDEERGKLILDVLLGKIFATKKVRTAKEAENYEDRHLGWANCPAGPSSNAFGGRVLEGMAALLNHLYLADHEVKADFIMVMDELPRRRWWMMSRLLLDRLFALSEGKMKAGMWVDHEGDVANAMTILRCMGGTNLFRKSADLLVDLIKQKVAAGDPMVTNPKMAGHSDLMGWFKANESANLKRNLRQTDDGHKLFEGIHLLFGLADIFPPEWLEAKDDEIRSYLDGASRVAFASDVIGHIPLDAFSAAGLCELTRSFLEENHNHIHALFGNTPDPRIFWMGDFSWHEEGDSLPVVRMQRQSKWSMGLLKKGNPDSTCRRCGAPVWTSHDRIRVNDGFALADKLGNVWIPGEDCSKPEAMGHATPGKGNVRAVCLPCRVEKILLEGGKVCGVGQRIVKLWNVSDKAITREDLKIAVGVSSPTTYYGLREATLDGWPETIAPGESVDIGMEGDAFAPETMATSLRRQAGRWGFVYQELNRRGFEVAIGFAASTLDANGLPVRGIFGKDVACNKKSWDLEFTRMLAVKCFMNQISRDRARGGRTAEQIGASTIYAADQDRVLDAFFAGLRVLHTSDRVPYTTKEQLIRQIYPFMKERKIKMAGTTIDIAEHVEFWVNNAHYFADWGTLWRNKGASTLAFGEAIEAAERAYRPGMTPDQAKLAQVQAASAALIKRLNPRLKRSTEAEREGIRLAIEEASLRILELAQTDRKHRRSLINTIRECVKATRQYKLDWSQFTPNDLEARLAKLVAIREAKTATTAAAAAN
jgi:hypothetical protein